MKITYTGRQVELAPAQLKKLEARFAKIGRLLDGKEERDAHVVLSLERKTHKAEATVHYYNHQLIGLGSDTDLFTAIHLAAEKLEKQCVKARTKWRGCQARAAQIPPQSENQKTGARRSRSRSRRSTGAPGLSGQARAETQAHDGRRGHAGNGQRPGLPGLSRCPNRPGERPAAAP